MFYIIYNLSGKLECLLIVGNMQKIKKRIICVDNLNGI